MHTITTVQPCFRNPIIRYFSALFLLLLSCQLWAQTAPTFNSGQDPKPAGKSWELVGNMSDEFNGSFDANKWIKNPTGNGWTWIGRPPGLFEEDNVSVSGGSLNVLTEKFSTPKVVNGTTWTHGGGIVRSVNPGQSGYYYECSMKANVTEMSSTFWLMTPPSNCNDIKKLELDIQECVGKTTSSTQSWAQTWHSIYHSNMIERTSGCVSNAVQIQGSTPLAQPANSKYYVYGAWWKSPTEVQFFLDGVYKYSITPNVPFTEEMFLQMAIEIYDWNPIPSNETIFNTASVADRSTHYDWIRTWKLVDQADMVSLQNAPTTMTSQTSYTVDMVYTASGTKELVLEFWNGSSWLTNAVSTVSSGSGVKPMTINLSTAAAPGSNYTWKAQIRPVGTTWQQATDTDQINNVTVTAAATQTPYGGVAWQIPGRVEAQNYDVGGEGVAYHDTDASNNGGSYRTDGVDIEATGDTNGDYNVGWMNTGEWLEYTTNVTTTQNYTFYVRVSSANGNGQFRIRLDGTDITGTKQVSNTGGWQTYQTISIPNISISSGQHVVRIEVVSGGMNLNFWSAWKTSGSRFGEELEASISSNAAFSAKAFPIPLGLNKHLHIDISLPVDGDIELSIIGLEGKVMHSETVASRTQGSHTLLIDSHKIQGLQKGLYFLKVISGDQSKLIKIIL